MNSSIPGQLKDAIASKGLTLYGAALIVGAEDLDTSIKAIHKRLTAYTSDSPPTSIAQLEETCRALGLTITIE